MKKSWETLRNETGKSEARAQKISTSIMSNDAERKRRSENAKMVVSRYSPDRMQNFHRQWREENPEEYLQTVEKTTNSFKSCPQIKLFELVTSLDNSFKINQFVYSEKFTTPTRRRQVDILSEKKKIAIEFDGPFHFRQIKKRDDLEMTKKKDAELNRVLTEMGYEVIRIAHDKFSYRDGGRFDERVHDVIRIAVESPSPGLLCQIGESYAE